VDGPVPDVEHTLLDGLGIDTGVDLHKVVETSVWMARQLGRPSTSRAVQALSSA
jgi:hydroxymethylglutaryl-CoA lyase